MTALPAPQPIAAIAAIDRHRFDADIRAAGQPVVLRGLAADWPAVQAGRDGPEATVAYLKRFSHDTPFAAIVGAPEIGGRFFYTPDLKALNFTRGQSPLDPFLDRLLRDRDAARPYAIAVQSVPAAQLLPGFEAENAIDLVDATVTPRLWLGNAIRVAPHYDLMENIGVVVAGRRRFTLFPPDQVGNLYMGPVDVTPAGIPVSLVDLAAPDLTRYPRFVEAMAHAQETALAPGDAIYIPYHWWHGVASLDAVNVFVNYWWNDAAPALGNPFDTMLHALFTLRGLPDRQRAAWRAMFDELVFRPNGESSAHIPPDALGLLGPPSAETYRTMRETLRRSI